MAHSWDCRVRSFALGNGCRKRQNFFIEPEVSVMVQMLKQGKYVLLTGPRQTGKTATVYYAMDLLQEEGYKCIYVQFPAPAAAAQSLKEFWSIVSHRIYMSSMGILKPPDTVHSGYDYEAYFISMLMSAEACDRFKDVILCFDEANHFCRLPEEFKNSFIDTLRHSKQLTGSRLLSLMLVGTGFLLEHLHIANCYRKFLGLKSSSGSEMSPFSHDAHLTTNKFTVREVSILLAQYGTFSGVFVEDGVASHIHALTQGHKGLVGVCCSLLESDNSMRENNVRTLVMWSHFAKMELTEKTFTRPTYQSMLNNCRSSHSSQQMLLRMLQNGVPYIVPWDNEEVVQTIEFLVNEGIVVDIGEKQGMSRLDFSNTLLHSCLLKQVVDTGHCQVETGRLPFDRIWVLERTIELLDMSVLLQPQSMNADGMTSEYALQFEFFLKLSVVLKGAYPLLEWIVIPEAKCEENRRRRLDLLVRDGNMRWFAFELLRQATLNTMKEHYERAKWYAMAHNCHVFVVNFVMVDREGVEFQGEEGAPVTVYNVIFSNDQRARLSGGYYGDGFEDRFLELKKVPSRVSRMYAFQK